jgi:zeta-carotene desaturase
VTHDAIVVGGGFAGLSAATALADRGARVLVLEARPTLGGRASAFTDPATGERVDNGQHVLFGCYTETFRFLKRIGAEANIRVQPKLTIDIVDRDAKWSRLACPSLPAPLHLLGGVLTWKALGWRDRLSIVHMRRAAARPDETVRAWLTRHHQTPRIIEVLWEPLAVAALNQSIDAAAAPSFAAILRPMFGSDPRAAALALPLKPLDEMYVRPASAFIESRGGTIRPSAAATIRVAPGTVTSVVTRDDTFSAATIICAVAWHALPNVFPDRPAALVGALDAAAQTAASPIVTVNLWLDRVVTDGMVVGLPGRTFQWVFDKRALFGEKASHLSLVSSGADEVVARSNQELIDHAIAEVRAALPKARGAAVLRGVVVREKRASFSVAPGQPPRPGPRTGIDGLFLAGDWIETGLPATIEGAVISGHAAADAASRTAG